MISKQVLFPSAASCLQGSLESATSQTWSHSKLFWQFSLLGIINFFTSAVFNAQHIVGLYEERNNEMNLKLGDTFFLWALVLVWNI